ncbi:baculoviral IAP repeat-containing protein 7 [Folsomia candida]|uniref:Baculoviral IAP repeat-containing protein 3 n=1 Tax=Folsomia candida TaxID=158441 RepID=A0A226D007_FOLCA|nr:baculoviral IAP repeat-containing protein 7 [Folsomia candida]XP_035700874.1 baculoviral IAP repeat-containing protein 7 [Folsomia candida]OXA38549.1 Baculoviral IAP repeat-containing protein 3 [Folsomia candida]
MIKSASSPSGSEGTVVEPTERMVMPQRSRMDSTPSLFRSSRDFENLKTERGRLATFSLPPGWPVTFIRPQDCAKTGFFYLEDGDKVQCAFCRGIAGEWEEGDNPSVEHRRHFPRCPFVCDLPVGNVPLGQEPETEEEAQAGSEDVCGIFLPPEQQPAYLRGARPLDENVAASLPVSGASNLVTYDARVKSFASKWPTCLTGQTPESLAEAGFSYLGGFDHVSCFQCKGALRNWVPGDDPWVQHARWFPNCPFVMVNKGDAFVKDVAKNNPPFQIPRPPHHVTSSPRRVSDQELRDLMDTSIVQAALEMGMELSKVKAALQRKMQQTGHAFLTTESLLDAVLRRRDPEYDSEPDTDDDDDDDDDVLPPRRYCPPASFFNGPSSTGTSPQASSSSSSSGGSGDETSPTTCTPRIVKSPSSQDQRHAGSSSPQSQPVPSEESSESGKELASKAEDSLNADQVEKENNNMEEELQQLRKATQCKICMDNGVEVVFLPCGHLVSCTRCATALSNCAVCRQPIKAYVKTYLA